MYHVVRVILHTFLLLFVCCVFFFFTLLYKKKKKDRMIRQLLPMRNSLDTFPFCSNFELIFFSFLFKSTSGFFLFTASRYRSDIYFVSEPFENSIARKCDKTKRSYNMRVCGRDSIQTISLGKIRWTE